MTSITRRRFSGLIGGGAASLALPIKLRARDKLRVVVVGGGAGGATAARYLAKDSDGALDVVLIDSAESYTSCFYSNLFLGGFHDREYIRHDYATLESEYGITKITDRATGVDRKRKRVVLSGGDEILYDRLILSPGIDIRYDSVPGYSLAASRRAPHAWQGGEQTDWLKTGLDALGSGDNIVMVAPPNPYRCPPGPYERASMMAHVLKSRGYTDSTITILDTKPAFSKQGLFIEGWDKYYPGMIDWIPPEIHGGILNVDAEAGTVETDFDTFEGSLLNIIPAQRAGDIAVVAGLTDDTGYCPVDADSMRSTKDTAIFVIGDASIAGAMPKSGFSANSQARVAAMQVRADLTGSERMPALYANTCWSLIAEDDGVKVGANYAAVDGKISVTSNFISQSGEDAERRKSTYEESIGWYQTITGDMFR